MSGFDADMYRRLLDSSPDAVSLIDAQSEDQAVVYVNAGFEALTGYAADEVLGRNVRFLQKDDREQEARQRLREAMARGETCRVLLRNYRKDGTLFWNEMSVVPLRDADGHVTHFAGHHRDASERMRVDAKRNGASVAPPGEALPGAVAGAVAQGAAGPGGAGPAAPPVAPRDDRLTGLFTLPYLESLLRRDWTVAMREHRSIAVFAIDIDALDLYNATFGRAAGDSAIRRVSHCVAGCLRRSSDVTARVDGGRLMAFAPGPTQEQALRLARTMAERVRELRIHHPRSAVLRYVSVSVGVCALVPEAAVEPLTLIDRAQQQLRLAKKAGRNQAA